MIFKAVLAIMNSAIGAGLIAIPFAFKSLGVINALIFLLLVTIFSTFSFYIISLLASKISSFNHLGKLTKPWLGTLVDLTVLAQSFGVCVAQLILMKNSLPVLFSSFINIEKQVALIAVMFILFPLSLMKSLKSLRFVSFVAMISILYIVSLLATFFVLAQMTPIPSSLPQRSAISFFRFDFNTLKSLPIFIFGLGCHQNIFKI